MKEGVMYRITSIRRIFKGYFLTEKANAVVKDIEGYRRALTTGDEHIIFVY